MTSREAMGRQNALLKNIRPLTDGKVFAPLPCYSQSADRLDEIIVEIAAILNPDHFPTYRKKFFKELPEKDPEAANPADRRAS